MYLPKPLDDRITIPHLPKMKQEACRAGGDALILGNSTKLANVSGGDDWIGSDDKLAVTATVVRWTD